MGRALPASLDHRLWGTHLPLRERAQVLRKAVGLAERHLAAGTLLSGAPMGRCRSLLPLAGRVCAGLSARPFFAARHEVMLQLMRLATHCRDSWVRRLRAPARMRLPLGDRFLVDYFPRPLEGGPPLLPYASRPPWALPSSVPLAARSAAARWERAVAHTARSAWSMGRRRAPGAEARAGASAATAGQATKDTPTPRRAHAVRGPCPGSRQDARCSSLRTGARGQPHCPPGWGGPAQPPRPSRTQAPRHAGARRLPERWAPAPPRHWGQTTPGPRSARRLTSWLTRGAQ